MALSFVLILVLYLVLIIGAFFLFRRSRQEYEDEERMLRQEIKRLREMIAAVAGTTGVGFPEDATDTELK